jgi:translation elongation factor EF-Tu-like GTPase
MTIEDVFSITGRGTVVTGRVSSGSIRKGAQVSVSRNGQQLGVTTVTGIEKFRDTLDEARTGDNVGLLLDGVQRDQVAGGDVLSG